ncbi:hypothetical protein LJK87_40150 [Paenibacillus sp. P25]|nr:hypothetical protein LJK87_40150 [Paenibacillus sp. P25]
MMRRWSQLLFAVIGGSLGVQWSDTLGKPFFTFIEAHWGPGAVRGQAWWVFIIAALLFYSVSSWAMAYFGKVMQQGEARIAHVPVMELMAGCAGMVVGLFLSSVLLKPFEQEGFISPLVHLVCVGLFALAGFRLGRAKKEELFSILERQAIRSGESPGTAEGLRGA